MSNQLRLDVAQLTDVGRKRPHNEDHMAHVIPKDPQTLSKKGALFVVADGMGGHAAGEIASEIAVETISVVYYQDDSEDIGTSLVHAIKRANTLIHQRAAENMLRSGMGTTCIAAVLRGSTAYIANVGDSRLYLVRNKQVQQISQDHSWVAEQVRAKLLTEEQARSHAQRNVITRCLGTQTDVDVDLFIEPLEIGDALVLCSDGLSGLIEEEELYNIVNQYVPQESVYHLIERANEHGGTDNITAIVVRVQEVGWEPAPAARMSSNGYANGHGLETSDSISSIPTLGLPTYPGRTYNGTPFHISSGPLGDDNFASFVAQPSRKRRRRLYSSLIISLLVLVALVGSGVFYLFHLNPLDVNGTLSNAQTLILDARSEIAENNPSLALQNLSKAQRELNVLQHNASLTSTQEVQLAKYNDDLSTYVSDAVNQYNQQASIVSPSLTPSMINTGSTQTSPSSIVTLQDAKKGNTLFYALGLNSILYQLTSNSTSGMSGMSLVNPFSRWPTNNTQVLTVVSDGPRLIAMTMVLPQNNTPATYSLNVLTEPGNGVLSISNSQKIQLPSLNMPIQSPTSLTVWGNDVYVALTSTTNPNQMTIAHYTVTNNKLNAKPEIVTVSTTTALQSMAAFPDKQLFFLFTGGNVSSMQFSPESKTFTPVSVQSPIAQPLPVQTDSFTASTPVPTPVTQPTATQQQNFLSLSTASLLVAGSVNGISHLYIVDSTNRRVLSLIYNTSPVVGATKTPTTGNGVISPGSPTTLKLENQFVDSTLPPIKGIVADANPKVLQVYVLTQSDTDTSKTTAIYALDISNPN